jgi:RNA polymerase subunit RPABC4/transcription elongation factor Spt4
VDQSIDINPSLNSKPGLPVRKPKVNGSESQEGKSKITYTVENSELKDKGERAAIGRARRRKKKTVSKAQCGACGDFIPVDSVSCPNCGVIFSKPEVELGACGNCGNLIPVSVKECPICGAKFE